MFSIAPVSGDRTKHHLPLLSRSDPPRCVWTSCMCMVSADFEVFSCMVDYWGSWNVQQYIHLMFIALSELLAGVGW